MYYIYKEAVYGHGVYWIGEDLEEGKGELDRLVSLDDDAHHDWNLYKYKPFTGILMTRESEGHELIMSVSKEEKRIVSGFT